LINIINENSTNTSLSHNFKIVVILIKDAEVIQHKFKTDIIFKISVPNDDALASSERFGT